MMLAGIINITARRESEQERDQQQKALERSNADLEEFAWTASHDLKAPLRAIGHLAGWIAADIATIANLAAETIDAESHTDAATAGAAGIGSYPWATKLPVNSLEVRERATFRYAMQVDSSIQHRGAAVVVAGGVPLRAPHCGR